MNFRIVLHLFKTDWLRLIWFVIGLWILMFLTAIPWWFSDPLGFTLPAHWNSGGSGNWIDDQREPLYSNPWVREPLIWSNLVRMVMALAIAVAIGMAGKSGMLVQPVRRRERIAANTLSIAILLVAPQVAIVAINLLINRFSPGVVAAATLDQTISAILVLAMAALFGAWCRTFWYCLASLAGLITAVGLVNFFSKSKIALLQLFFEQPWGYPQGYVVCLFAFAAILLLGGSLPWARLGTGSVMRIALTVVLLTLAAYISTFAKYLPRVDANRITASSPDLNVASIKPSLTRAWIDRESSQKWNRFNKPISNPNVAGKLITTACPPGHAVEWSPTGNGFLSQQGKQITKVAAIPEHPDSYGEAERSVGYFTPRDFVEGPVMAALPGGIAANANRWTTATSRLIPSMSFGEFEKSAMAGIDANKPVSLTLELAGIVYRYEPVLNVPLENAPSEVKAGNVTWRVRRFPTESGDLRADLVVTHPAIAFASEPEEIRWDASPATHCLFYFHFPKNNVTLRVDSSFYAVSPLLAGAGWHRTILGINSRSFADFNPNLSLEGARLIILKPVVVARVPAIEVSIDLSPADDYDPYHDFSLGSRYSRDSEIYQENLITQRPDPRTCSRKEFGRWLRVAAAAFPWETGSAIDLASYAPRFADVMAKVSRKESVKEALRRGVPESQKGKLLDGIATDPLPLYLIDVAFKRGWAHEAKDSILQRHKNGDALKIDSVMYLEDATSYPDLLENFIAAPDLQTYENIRMLPGIEPLLDQTIAEGIGKASISQLVATASSHQNRFPYGPFLIAAKRGNKDALDAVLTILKAGGTQGTSFYQPNSLNHIFVSPVLRGNSNQIWLDYLEGKTSSDFRFDPLARIWRLH